MSYDFMKYAVLRGEENIKKTVEFAGNILSLYKCHQCGNCCRTIPVELDEDDVIKLVKIEGESFWEKLDEKKLIII